MSLRAFIPPDPGLRNASQITLCSEESHYLVRVRRAKSGAACELLDRQGHAYLARVIQADPRACVLEVESCSPPLPERPHLELWLGMPDSAALLTALSRATELGAHCIRLLRCAYAQGRRPSAPRIARCLDASMRQCGRRSAPLVIGPVTLEEALTSTWEGCSWLASPQGEGSPPQASRLAQRVAIGPEGGFNPQERASLEAAGFRGLGLGPFILRSEVAVTAALARLQ